MRMPHIKFSQRLTWGQGSNALAEAEARLRAAGQVILDLTTSNPTRVALPYPAEALAQAFADPAMAHYEPAPLGSEAARAEVAADYARRGVTVRPEHLALTASSSESYSLLFKLLCDPGDIILVPEPSYPLFDYLARLDGVVPRPYRLAFDGEWHVDLSSVDLTGARALVLVNPNNPTGSFVREHDLARLAALCADAGIAIISDEVFADYPLAPAPDAVRTLAGRELPALTFCLGGLSKACGLPQLKLGWIAATGPEPLVSQALHRLELVADTYLSVGTPVQCALPRVLVLGAAIRAAIRERIAENHRAVQAALAPASPITLLPAEGGWSAILRMPAILSDEAWALTLLERDRVLVQPGYFFDLPLGASLVVSLLVAPEVLREGMTRLLARVTALMPS